MRLGQSSCSSLVGVAAWGVLFAVIGGFYVATFSFRNISDTDINSFQTRALALHGDVDLSRYRGSLPQRSKSVERDGELYSTYGIGVSVSALPVYAIAARTHASDRVLQAAASIPFVAASVLVLCRFLLRAFSRAIAVGMTIVFAFGTTMWPVAAMGFFQHGPAALFQTIGITGLFGNRPRAPVLAGFGFAIAAFIRPTFFVPLFIIGVLYLLEGGRKAVAYAAGATPALVAVLVQNRWIWGSWFSGAYTEHGVGFRGDMPHALYGLLFGWWRGIFVYSPVLIVSIFGAVAAMRGGRNFLERRMIALAISSIAVILVYSRWSVWHGGTSQFGYRLLLDIVPFLVVLVAHAVSRVDVLRSIAKPLGAVSILVMAVGAAPNIYGWETGAVDPSGIEQTSLGQSWINLAHHPGGTILRVGGVAAVAALLYFLAPTSQLGPRGDNAADGVDDRVALT